jgi:hypothetical protein
MRRLPVLALVLLAGEPGHAAEQLPSALAPIVAAERAFARRCGLVGIRASFLEFFAGKAINFAPEPGLARPRLEGRPVPNGPPPVVLEWGPEQAEVAPGGDLGWTTGPARVIPQKGARPTYTGYYFSLWRKQPDGRFKVVLDMGTETPPAPIPTSATAVGPTLSARSAAGPTAVKKVDEDFCKRAESGAGAAYAAALARNGRVHREKATPIVGDQSWRRWASSLAGVMSCQPSGAEASAGLGYTWGSYQRRDRAGGAIIEKGFYTRVWRLDGHWQIAADVANVLP